MTRFRARLALAAAGCLLAGATPPALDPLDAPLAWNGRADRAACPVASSAVWAAYAAGGDCIRYFSSAGIDAAAVALIVLQGDRHRAVRMDPRAIPRNTPRAQSAIAERMARLAGVPAIVVERPGTYGSSGNHLKARRIAEFAALDAALDAIRRRHRIGRLVLYGHSGGATASAAMLTMGRRDISCAVLASGAFALTERAALRARRGAPPRDLYDPLDHVAGVVRDPARRIIVVGDPRDRITPFPLQRRFADALRRRGHRVEVISRPALPPDFHTFAGGAAMDAVKACAGQI